MEEEQLETESPPPKQASASPAGERKRNQSEDMITPPAKTISGPIRIAERARLSLKGARAVAGKTLQRWTSNIASAAQTGTGPSEVTSQDLSPAFPPPPPNPGSARVSASIEVTDSTLLRIAARPPGCLFDEKFLTRLARETRSDTSPKNYLLVEVQFRDRAGLTLDVSRVYEERIYVDGFSTDDSPALLSNAVMVGDTLLSAAGGDRWLRSSGDLNAISQFIRDCVRPVTIRFLRDLIQPITLTEVHEDPSKAAFWLEFLTEHSTVPSSGTVNNAGAGEMEQVYTIDPVTMQLKSIWDGKSLAQFALDARFSEKTEAAVEAIVERHLPFARTPAEQSLIDWYHARRLHQDGNTAEASSFPSPSSSPMDAIPVFDVLEYAGRQIEDALAQAYFKRFLHSRQAKSLFKELNVPYERLIVKACATEVSLEAVLSRRDLANLFLAHCLPRYHGVHPKLLLYMDMEFALRPALDAADESFQSLADDQAKVMALKRVWAAASRTYERFLSPKGACYCGELSQNINANMWAACSAFSRETWGETGFCSTCGCESSALWRDLSERVEAMNKDPTDVGFASLELLRSLAFHIQTETLEFLRRPFVQFCQDPHSWFPVVVEGFNAEVAAQEDASPSVIPRFSQVLQHGISLPRGVETHRAPLDYFGASTTSTKKPVRCILKLHRTELNQIELKEVWGEGVPPEGLAKFAFPWLSNLKEFPSAPTTPNSALVSPNKSDGTVTDEEDEEDDDSNEIEEDQRANEEGLNHDGMCFNFVLGSEKLYGITLACGNDALVIVSDLPLFDRLRDIMKQYWDNPAKYFESEKQIHTSYGHGLIIGNGGDVVTVRVGEMTLPFESPALEKKEICVGCGEQSSPHHFWFPPAPRKDFSYDVLLESLSLRNIILLFACLLLERKILLVSSKYSVLSVVGESLCSLLHPLRWSHVYAPLLPRKMLDLLMCPTPFLLGIHSSYAFKSDFPFATDLIVVNLDTDEVTLPGPSMRLPPNMERHLLERMRRITCQKSLKADDASFVRRLPVMALEATIENEGVGQLSRDEAIREAFRLTILEIVNKVQLACFSVEHRGEFITFIDENFWLNGKRADELEFFATFLRTQAFSSFVGGMRG